MNSLVEVIAGRGPAGCSATAKSGSGRAGRMLADFLESDLQGSERAADIVLERIDAVRTGKEAPWVRSGNGYLLIVSADRAVLEDLYPTDHSDPRETIENRATGGCRAPVVVRHQIAERESITASGRSSNNGSTDERILLCTQADGRLTSWSSLQSPAAECPRMTATSRPRRFRFCEA
jgi:hypothetical protein